MSDNSSDRPDRQKESGSGKSSASRRRRGGRGNAPRRFYSECPVCGKGVRDLLTAIAWGEERKPAHFDCILKDISDKEELLPREKLIYMGAGSFGIVKFRSGGSSSAPRFVIRKRIQLEEKEEKFEWRRQISRKIR
jgi:hypothetical protein